jgi:hypothetical protein
MTKIIFIVLLVITIIGGGFLIYGNFSSGDYYSQAMHQLDLNFQKQNRKIFLKSDASSLPLPVKKYFLKAIKEGQIYPKFVRFKETGTYRTNLLDKWEQISTEGYYSTDPFGLLWMADIKHYGFIPGDMSEYYLEGKGTIQNRILTGIKIFEQNGLQTNELMLTKFVTYAVLFPSTLLPNDDQKWEGIDNDKAKLTLFNNGNNVVVVFHFDKNNLPEKITSYEAENGTGLSNSNTFVTHLSNYQRKSGFLIPTHLEYEWMISQNQFIYGKIDISSLEYNIPEFF